MGLKITVSIMKYLTTLAFCFTIVNADEHERRLYTMLLENYNVLVRPVENNSNPVNVTLGIVLQQIVDVTWHDYQLKWNPLDFGNVSDIRMPADKLWRPDVLLYNSVDTNFDSTYAANFVVYSSGLVNWIPPGILRSSCNIDITWFPFDDQICHLKFGSWTYNGWKLNLQPDPNGTDTSEFIENGEWLLIEPYPDLLFSFHLRRRTLYYAFNMIIPSVLISLMTLLGFALPVESGEKVTLEITILLSVCVFLSTVASMTPATSESVPLIGAFFSCNMLVVSASVVFSVLVLNLHYRTPDTYLMTPFMRKFLLNWLPWLLAMQRPGQKFNRKNLFSDTTAVSKTSIISSRPFSFVAGGGDLSSESESLIQNIRCENGGGLTANSYQQHRPTSIYYQQQQPQQQQQHNPEVAPPLVHQINVAPAVVSHTCPVLNEHNLNGLLMRLHQINVDLKFIIQRMKKEDDEQEAKNDWKFAAMVVDRLCLYVFSITIVASTCGILFSAPHLIA